ncbi:gastric triacylglycerol lipase isoform X1 [Hydra vulgaris]|uniref:gastric triacylglycerol lipase isoform X1 n=1 Tax=Hydra vulgaris TaxID=6087 RepID=UPI001F5E8514|nr:gastric triacylglycerol lipase isoform X1 [Hydra vulgaris]
MNVKQSALHKMKTLVFFNLYIVTMFVSMASSASVKRVFAPKFPEESLSASEIIAFYGYPSESHYVKTDDGYILTLHRIPHGLFKPSNGKTVYLQHGLLDSSAAFLMNPPQQSLGFILADEGYDVWLGNSRGNTYSSKHINLTTKNKEFWDFSFDEMAKYDLPASINYVLKKSNKTDLFYVGHSQGTTIGFIAFGENKELATKIRAFIALAPVATVKHIRGAIKTISTFTTEIELLIKIFGLNDFLPQSYFMRFLAQDICGLSHSAEIVCSNVAFLISGFDVSNLNKTRLPVYMSHLPAGTSSKDMIHFAQMIKSGKFQMFDYGKSGNIKRYNQEFAPLYNISKVKVPVALFTGTNDWLSDPTDVNTNLRPFLPNIVFSKNIDAWNHVDFIWGIDANKMIYEDIIKLMN